MEAGKIDTREVGQIEMTDRLIEEIFVRYEGWRMDRSTEEKLVRFTKVGLTEKRLVRWKGWMKDRSTEDS